MTRYTIEGIEFDVDYCFRVVPVRVMRSKRTTSVCSSSTRTSSRDDLDEVDNSRNSDNEDDESDSENDEEFNEDGNDKRSKVVIPVTYEYVSGTPSSVIHYKLPKSESSSSTATINLAGNVKSSSKSNLKAQQTGVISKRNHQQSSKQVVQQSQTSVVTEKDEDSDNEKCEIVNSRNVFLRIWDTLQLFFNNPSKLSTHEESFVYVCLAILFAITVGVFIHAVGFSN